MKKKTDFKKTVFNTYSQNEKTLLALSGGADSTLLFYLLLELQKECSDFSFGVFHLNHSLRDEAFEEADFIQLLCEQHGIPCYLFEKDIQKEALKHKLSIEEAGRYWRYFYLNGLLVEKGFDSITTAHHQDDALETFFLRLFMYPSLGALVEAEVKNEIKRPLLAFSKEEILKEVKKREIVFKQDLSNFESKYPRNFLRNEIFPRLKEKFPAFKSKVFQLQSILKEKLEFLDSFLLEWNRESNYEYSLSLEDFFKVPKALWAEEILLGLKALNKGFYLSFKQLTHLKQRLKNLDSSEKQQLIVKEDFELLISYSKLFWVKKDFYKLFYVQKTDQFFNELSFANEQFLLKSKRNIRLKIAEKGEKILFNNHLKKLKDVLIDHKVYYHHRKLCRLILDENENCLAILNPCLAKVYAAKQYRNDLLILKK